MNSASKGLRLGLTCALVCNLLQAWLFCLVSEWVVTNAPSRDPRSMTRGDAFVEFVTEIGCLVYDCYLLHLITAAFGIWLAWNQVRAMRRERKQVSDTA